MRAWLLVLSACAAPHAAAVETPRVVATVERDDVRPLALIERTWPTVYPTVRVRSGGGGPGTSVVVMQLGPPSAEPATAAQLATWRREARSHNPTTRIHALDRLAQALDAEAAESLDEGPLRAVADAYQRLIANRHFARSPHRDEIMFRAARALVLANRVDAGRRLYEQLIAWRPPSRYQADALISLADLASSPSEALRLYERANDRARGTLAVYTQLRIAELHAALGFHQRALDQLVKLLRSADRDMDLVITRAMIGSFSEVGDPATAWQFFTTAAPDHEPELAWLLTRTYLDDGKVNEARTMIRAALDHDLSPDEICEALPLLVRASLFDNDRDGVLAAARGLVRVVEQARPECRVITEELLGDTALAWQAELPKSHVDPQPILALWDTALAITTTPELRASALRHRAYLAWQVASTERLRARAHAAWSRAADALHAAAEANPTDAQLLDGERDARANAAAVAARRR